MGRKHRLIHDRVLMECFYVSGTYRAFKFPLVANPTHPPDVYSNASSIENRTTTSVYASWNGATEVASWTLYKTTKNGARVMRLTSAPRSGFETAINYAGYASYVFVQAEDEHGKTIGKSAVIETATSKDISSAAIAEELLWLRRDTSLRGDILGSPMVLFMAGLICGAIIVLITPLVVKKRRRWVNFRRNLQYERVAVRDAAEYNEMTLDDLSSSKSYSDEMDGNVFKVSEEDDDEDERT